MCISGDPGVAGDIVPARVSPEVVLLRSSGLSPSVDEGLFAERSKGGRFFGRYSSALFGGDRSHWWGRGSWWRSAPRGEPPYRIESIAVELLERTSPGGFDSA